VLMSWSGKFSCRRFPVILVEVRAGNDRVGLKKNASCEFDVSVAWDRWGFMTLRGLWMGVYRPKRVFGLGGWLSYCGFETCKVL
jgi:hypothetical protein